MKTKKAKSKNDKEDKILTEGSEVKLNYQRITKRKEWLSTTHGYQKFVERNKDTVFHVEFDKRYHQLAALMEDDSVTKWLFVTDDLLVKDKGDGKFREPWKIAEVGN